MGRQGLINTEIYVVEENYLSIRPYKINYLFLIHLFLKNGEGGGILFYYWLIKLATVQCKRILLRIVKYKCTSLNWMEKGPGNETTG